MTIYKGTETKADIQEKLPAVELPDRLASAKWGESLRNQAGDMSDDAALNAAAGAHERMATGVQNITAQRDTQDPSVPQLQHLRQVETNVNGLTKKAARETDNARAGIKQRKQELHSEFERNMKFDEKDASEIRGMLRSMNDKERQEFMGNAINNGDGNVMGAVFKSHPSLSGLTQDQRDAQYRRALNAHAPQQAKLIQTLDRADELLFESFNDLLSTSDTLSAKEIRSKKEAEARKAQEAKEKANSGFGVF